MILKRHDYCGENRCVATPFCLLHYLQSIFSLFSVDLNVREEKVT